MLKLTPAMARLRWHTSDRLNLVSPDLTSQTTLDDYAKRRHADAGAFADAGAPADAGGRCVYLYYIISYHIICRCRWPAAGAAARARADTRARLNPFHARHVREYTNKERTYYSTHMINN